MSVNYERLTGSDEQLLTRLFSKHVHERELAWKLIYKNDYPAIRDFIRKNHGSESDATDIFQDGLMILHRNLYNGTFREEATIKTYIFRICRNLWLKELQKKQKQIVLTSEIAACTGDDSRAYLINVEIIALLMNELKDDCRNILIEYYYNNKTMAELKEMFNVNSIQAAKNKKLRCMGYLVRLCKERGIKPTPPY